MRKGPIRLTPRRQADILEALGEIEATVAALRDPTTWAASTATPSRVTRLLVSFADAWIEVWRRSGPDDASWELAIVTWDLVNAGPERKAIEKWKVATDEIAGRPLRISVASVRTAFDKVKGRGSSTTAARTLFQLAAARAPTAFGWPHADTRRGLRGPLAELLRSARGFAAASSD